MASDLAGKIVTIPYGDRKGWKFIDDDWFRFLYEPGTPDEVIGKQEADRTEVHELCARTRCRFGQGECPFHPRGCGCSMGACQEF